MNDEVNRDRIVTRRSFLRSAAVSTGVLATASALALGDDAQTTKTADDAKETTQPQVHPWGKETLRVGLIGAGGRGRKATLQSLQASPAVVVVAVGDIFQDCAEKSLEILQKEGGDRCKATKETCFYGWDNYQKVIDAGVDLVILGAPPHFRPQHLRAAIDAGKHVFMEKPVAVDPVGIRSVIESSEMARQKGLAIVAGTQRRHDASYLETIKRIKDGAIGDIVAGEAFWCQGGLWHRGREEAWTDMEWQVRNWLYFDWLSGDHIVEQHVHNLDVINWVIGSPPERAFGVGGRQVRTDPKYGNIFDHFAIEYEYPNGARVLSISRQIEKSGHRVSEFVIGTKGTSDPNGRINGPNQFKYEKDGAHVDPYVQEHIDLIKSIMDGKPLNEGKQVAESTLTAIIGRMAAYTGQTVSFNKTLNSSKLDLTPAKYEFGPNAINPIPVPGETPLV
jgi:myo-inositol 2-dehydrogenase / D-chiro-inositol 1-dehydrogenase